MLTGVVPVSLSEEEGTPSSGDDMREDRDDMRMVPGRLRAAAPAVSEDTPPPPQMLVMTFDFRQ